MGPQHELDQFGVEGPVQVVPHKGNLLAGRPDNTQIEVVLGDFGHIGRIPHGQLLFFGGSKLGPAHGQLLGNGHNRRLLVAFGGFPNSGIVAFQ
jgi:hypothetical protein